LGVYSLQGEAVKEGGRKKRRGERRKRKQRKGYLKHYNSSFR
jgi:hypothetical protein